MWLGGSAMLVMHGTLDSLPRTTKGVNLHRRNNNSTGALLMELAYCGVAIACWL